MRFAHLTRIDREIRRHLAGCSGADILLITMPPRHGKSQLVSRYLPAWYLWRWPHLNVILCSYGMSFAKKWGRLSRGAFVTACELLGPLSGLNPNRQAADEWETLHGGGMKVAGIGGDVTGRPADLIIGDDLIKNAEEAASETRREATWEWWKSTVLTRLEPGGKVINIGTRWHRDDYQSRMLTQWDAPVRHVDLPAICEREGDLLKRTPVEAVEDSSTWTNRSALWPVRWSAKALAKKRKQLGDYWFFAEYQGKPRQHDKAEWPDSYFEDDIWVDRLPDAFDFAVVAIDPARGLNKRKGSFVPDVFVGWSGNCYWVWADVARRPVEDAAVSAVRKALTYDTDLIYVEGNGVQHLVANVVREVCVNSGIPHQLVQAVDTVGNKENRIRRLGPYLQEKRFKFLECPGNRVLVEQLKECFVGDHFDGPDALEMAHRSVNALARAGAMAAADDEDD